MDFSRRRGRRTAPVAAIRTLHRTIQSVGATGGVYKGQGRSQRELMTRAYWEFLVHGENYTPQSLARRRFNGLPDPFGPGQRPVDSFSVARVRPRTSKGITDLLLPQTSVA